jgi:hypothetical protein
VIQTHFRLISCTSKPFLPPDSSSQDISHCSLEVQATNFDVRFVMEG